MELTCVLYPSGGVARKRVAPQTALVHHSDSVGYAILYLFNLIRRFSSHLALIAFDKNPGIFEVLLEETCELDPHHWGYPLRLDDNALTESIGR